MSLGEPEDAPDGSRVTPLVRSERGSLCLGTLPPGAVSKTVAHRTVEELWFIRDGSGLFFCEAINAGAPFPVQPGHSFAVPPRSAFQFRNTGDIDLEFVITTMPPWPGPQEAYRPGVSMWEEGGRKTKARSR